MYQTNSPLQPEANDIHQYNHAPNIVIQPTLQMSPYLQPVQQMPHQASPISCFSVDARSFSSTQLPMPSPMSLNDYPSHSNNTLSQSPQLSRWRINHQAMVPPLTLDDDLVYNCNFLGQLQGEYEVETPAGKDQVSVIVPTVAEGEEQYAIVRRVCSDGEALPDLLIYQEPTQFTLNSVGSMEHTVEAVFRRGSNMKYTVSWVNVVDGGWTVWRRKGEVTFNLVLADSLAPSRRYSINSSGSALSSCVNSPIIGPNGMPMKIRPELLQQNSTPQIKPLLTNFSSGGSHISNVSLDSNRNNNTSHIDVESDNREDSMFELIKAHCLGNSSLLRRIVQWAMSDRSMRRVSSEDLWSLSEGRLWVTAHAADFVVGDEIGDDLQETLEDIKGAYREVRSGVYKQPEPKLNEPGVQHRLMRGPRGCWKIESHDLETGKWIRCAEQLYDGRWVDIKNNKEVIRVQLIPMSKILQKICEEFTCENQEVVKSIEFLFTNCNQKKLNSKLKGRNLKHNISNLKVKLEKQYALRFAVQVANTADAIARDLDILC